MLKNERIVRPGVFEGETFYGTTTLAFNGRYKETYFRNCKFIGDGRGSWHGIHVPAKYKPLAVFEDCEIEGYDKGAVIQWCGMYNTFVHDNGDGIFAQSDGQLHIEGGRIWRVGGLPGDHADGFQMMSGRNVRLVGVNFDLESEWTNSCIFLESKVAVVNRVTVSRCRLRGGNYLIYCWKDESFAGSGPREVSIIRNDGDKWRFAPVAYNDVVPEQSKNSWQDLKFRHQDGNSTI